jgi:hypothetical protein
MRRLFAFIAIPLLKDAPGRVPTRQRPELDATISRAANFRARLSRNEYQKRLLLPPLSSEQVPLNPD